MQLATAAAAGAQGPGRRHHLPLPGRRGRSPQGSGGADSVAARQDRALQARPLLEQLLAPVASHLLVLATPPFSALSRADCSNAGAPALPWSCEGNTPACRCCQSHARSASTQLHTANYVGAASAAAAPGANLKHPSGAQRLSSSCASRGR